MGRSRKTEKTKGNAGEYDLESYQSLGEIDHILQRPDMYVGSPDKSTHKMKLFDPETRACYKAVTGLPDCTEQAFVEFLTNASDNVTRSRNRNVDPGPIIIDVRKKWISILNFGIPFPIKQKEYEGEMLYLPEYNLTKPRTGTNLGEKSEQTGGRNGIGAFASVVWSTNFVVEVDNKKDDAYYYQEYNNNMKEILEPVIEPYSNAEKRDFVKVSYKFDFGRSQLKRYSREMIHRFAYLAAGVAATQKVEVVFNGISLVYPLISEFAFDLLGVGLPSDPQDPESEPVPQPEHLIRFDWPDGVKVKKTKDGNQVDKDGKKFAGLEVCVLDTPDEGEFYAFSNGLPNPEGGTHVEAVYDALRDNVLPDINKKLVKDGGKKLTKRDIKRHLTIVVFHRDEKANYSNQQKHRLKTAVSTTFTEAEIKKIKNWKLVTRLTADLKAKRIALLEKESDGKKGAKVNMDKLIDANWAKQGKKRDQCVLGIMEGDSAALYEKARRALDKDRANWIGILIGKGKWINPRTKTDEKFFKNDEVKMLRKALGIRAGVEPTLDNLRYTTVMIRTDADVDGDHIAYLIVLVLLKIAPVLVESGRVYIARTPLLKAWIPKKRAQTVVSFYSESEYEEWKKATPNANKYTEKYYKGLATSNQADIKENDKDPMDVCLLYKEKYEKYLNVAGGPSKEFGQQRREWIQNFIPDDSTYQLRELPLKTFINKQFIKHPLANIARTIPKFEDGCKESYRKFLYGCFKKWKRKATYDNTVKLAQISSYVSEVSGYHYGEASLYGVGATIAAKFAGGFNMNYLYPDGMFGSRTKGYKDCGAPRYVYTCLEAWVAKMFLVEDDIILNYKGSGKEQIEPEYYLPVLPPLVINGPSSIATGWRGDWLNHHPLHVGQFILDLLDGEQPDILIPWYRGFKGIMELHLRSDKKSLQELKENEEAQDQIVKTKLSDDAMLEDEDAPSSEIKFEEEELAPEEEDEVQNSGQDEDSEEDTPKGPVETEVVFVPKSRSKRKLGEGEELEYEPREVDPNQFSTCVSKGVFKVLNKYRINDTEVAGEKDPVKYAYDVEVTEIPVNKTISYYARWLSRKVESDELDDTEDLCGPNYINFVLKGFKHKPTYKSLNLVSSVSMSNMNCLVDGKPRKFRTTEEYIYFWLQWRLGKYAERKQKQLDLYAEELGKLQTREKFFVAVNEGELDVKNWEEEQILAKLDEMEIPATVYKEAKISQLTKKKIDQLRGQIEAKKKEIKLLEKTPHADLMYNDVCNMMDAWEEHCNSKEEQEFWKDELKEVVEQTSVLVK